MASLKDERQYNQAMTAASAKLEKDLSLGVDPKKAGKRYNKARTAAIRLLSTKE